jgi:hypothetical protein
VVIATALQLVAALIAARQIGVVRDEGDDLTALLVGIGVIALSVLAAATLRGVRGGRGRRRRAPS